MMKLFAVYLGGRAPKCNTELHDVVFVTGETIADTYEQLMDKWFGTQDDLHLDSYVEVDVVDGYRIGLSETKTEADVRLFFVNLGAYKDGEFTEYHANKLLISDCLPNAKKRAKSEMLTGWGSPVHTDDLYDVDDCIEVAQVGKLYVTLTKTGEVSTAKPTNGYHLVPKGIVEEYMKRHATKAA
ncbi:MAG TPA: DUF1543 domain-containing protein [Alphaproteobacteria bacterium]|nr:DUF1543 domain-containing protein [Alphaproteobacteria bacterium]